MKTESNGVYETDKMLVEISPASVFKVFKQVGNFKTRYQRELCALRLLSGLQGFPVLIESDDIQYSLKMSRLNGNQPQELSEHQITRLREMTDAMLAQGVARHAMPIRDLITSNGEYLGMVDFERVTFRGFSFSPIWWIAKRVTYYHLYRLINSYQPQLLSVDEKRALSRIDFLREGLVKLKPLKNRVKVLFQQSEHQKNN